MTVSADILSNLINDQNVNIIEFEFCHTLFCNNQKTCIGLHEIVLAADFHCTDIIVCVLYYANAESKRTFFQ